MIYEEIKEYELNYIVCQCYEVTFGDIIEAIENGYDTQEAIIYETKAGYGCERCQSQLSDANNDRELHIETIIDYVKSRESLR